MAMDINLKDGQRAQRKQLITVAEWTEGTESLREILGVRTEDSSIDLNPDIETTTDILGYTYTDVNKTEPQQTLDPSYIIGGSALKKYLTQAMLKNDIQAYNGAFNVYIITAFISETTGDPVSTTSYYAVKHTGCSIIPTSIGGDNYVDLPIEVHFSNKITEGSVDKLGEDFVFTADANL
jgi:hypothetical protein